MFEFARADPVRARALADAYRWSRRTRGSNSARALLDAHRAARAHHRDRRHRLADAQFSVAASAADSAAWIAEVLNEPHTRELLDTILVATAGSWRSWR